MKAIVISVLSMGVLLSSIDNSIAQTTTVADADTVQSASVSGRARPDYDALGIRTGSFYLYPSVVETFTYDDNVFSTKTNKQTDTIIQSAPTLNIMSDWGRHSLGIVLGIVDIRHTDFSKEDHTDYNSSADFRVDVTRSFNIGGKLGASLLSESRGDSDAPAAAAEPTQYKQYDASLSLNKQFNRFTFQLGGGVQSLDYDDVKAVGGGTLDQDIRDGETVTGLVKAAYEFSPGYRVFGIVEGNRRDYGGIGTGNRDSKGIEGRAGLEFEVSRLVQGSISAGYFEQDYELASYSNTGGMAFKGNLLWNPTQMMTVSLSGERRISETSLAGSPGHVDTLFTSRIDYEIMRNLIGSPFLDYTIEDYQGITREDKTLKTGVSMKLLINRYLSAGTFYSYTQKDSSIDTFDYDKSTVGGNIKLQF